MPTGSILVAEAVMVAASIEIPLVILALVLGGIGFLLGRKFEASRSRRREAPPPGKDGDGTHGEKQRPDDEYDDAPERELWEQLVDATYRDFRVQAIGGRDPDFYPTLKEPLFIAPEIQADSPLLPGELTVDDVTDTAEFRREWEAKRETIIAAAGRMDAPDASLYRHLIEDLLDNLKALDANTRLFRLSLRTPGHFHMVLYDEDLKGVVGVVPGLASLHTGSGEADSFGVRMF